MRLGIKAASVAAVASLMATSAFAVTSTEVICGTPDSKYNIAVDPALACGGWGPNSLPFADELAGFQANNADIEFLGWAKREPGGEVGGSQWTGTDAPNGASLSSFAQLVGLELTFADDPEIEGFGTWAFSVPDLRVLNNVILGVRLGAPGDPVEEDLWWATFWLPQGATEGTWTVLEYNSPVAFSEVLPEEMYVWGRATIIPLPPAMLLLGSALGGLVLLRRRKQAA